MNDTNNKAQVQSNEEVVEELTRDLKSSCIEPNENSSTNVPSSDARSRDAADDDSWNIPDEEHTAESNNENAQNTDPEEVIENLLKDRDSSLTECEKETLKCEAETRKQAGNDFYKKGEYVEAISRYTEGLQTCPLVYSKERSILYANRAAAKAMCQTEKDSVISDCTKAIELNPSYVKAYVRRAQAYEESDKLDEALEDYKKVLTFDSSHKEANHAVMRLPPLIEERNEKLKMEMLGKLKDLGNMVLKPFGLSTNNFELEKNPNSEGYSVKFRQNPT
ncbi:tetratricopeptide repeat protein 1 [Pseudomyrmex gracilis]|uniref:tetratricopeptide repeat protein 1 n=1 Tax=Pseudomyrmex gracilis TaxID=219809 RepID=UPI000994F75B|nr:tetratricopeptide repeat protein 1 [Pseudomyrmex gracilis]